MNVKHTFSALRRDPVVIGGVVLALASIVIACLFLWQRLVIDARVQAANLSYGENIRIASSRVDNYINDYQQQLAIIASQPPVALAFETLDQLQLDQLENHAASLLAGATGIYFLGPDLQRHRNSVGYAGRYMAQQTLNGKTVSPRAVKTGDHWQILSSRAVFGRLNDQQIILGAILISLPMQGLSNSLSSLGNSEGLVELQQIVPNRDPVTVLQLGAELSPDSLSAANSDAEVFDTGNPFWKIRFSPSQSLFQTINQGLPPFWMSFSAVVAAVATALYLIIVLRVRRGATVRRIFIDDEIDDALMTTKLDIASDIASTSTMAVHQDSSPITEINQKTLKPQAEDCRHSDYAVPDVVFRDYDIRGIAGQEITPEFALRLGRALGRIVLSNGLSSIYMGRDGRLSSPELCSALASGLVSTGCNLINLGQVTTPVVNFAVHHQGQASCAVMVTASHNPGHYNGFKIIIKGQVISGSTLQELKPLLMESDTDLNSQGQTELVDIIPDYVRYILEQSAIDRSFKIVVDAGNAVAGPVALKLLDSLGCTTFPLYCDVDGAFPNHQPNPADEDNLQDLIAEVKTVGADLGLAFDGDGDRLVVISGRGEIIWPDRLMMIFARDILLRHPGADIVFDVKSSKRLTEIVRKYSGRPVMCKTGHSHVRRAVQDNNAPVGGEFSGHIFFNDRWKGFDDGLYAAVRLLEILCAESPDKTLDTLVAEFETSSYSPEILIPVDESEKFSLMKTLAAGCQFKGAQIITLDGLRVEYPNGWGLVRASNTSASLTLRFEADDDGSLEQIKQLFRNELSPFINNIEDFI
ncbi:MAG: phosphomannomutase/phosphoglucomutase [Porticoccaceae bacterium]|nr:phosphomannomutase/phosphoglucomutase [Porticoccaceae bacterium]